MAIMEPQVTNNTATSELTEYAKKWMQTLVDLEPNRSPEDIEEIKAAVRKLALRFSSEGPEAAEAEFRKSYNAYQAVAQTNAAMEELEASAPKGQGLGKVGDRIAGMNVVQARLLGGILQKFPVGGSLGAAIHSLAAMEETMIGLSGKPQVFATFGEWIKRAGGELERHGIDTSIDGLREHAQQLLASDQLSQVRGIVQNVGAQLSELKEGEAVQSGLATVKRFTASLTPGRN